MSTRYYPHGKRYGKTHCPRAGVMVSVEPRGKSNLPSRALVIGPSKRAGYVEVQFRHNAGWHPFEVSCDRLSKAMTKRGSRARLIPYDASRPAHPSIDGARRRRRKRRR